MFKISIDMYTLFGIAIIGIVLIVITICIFIAYIVHDNRKFNSINEYNRLNTDKSLTYDRNIKKYNMNVKKSGVNHNKKYKINFFKTIIDLFKKN